MKCSDYVADFIAQQGVSHVFLISGGAVVHLVDSVARHPRLRYVCTQHEQGAGAAADAYSRITENLGVAVVTSGPGATNLVTSVCNAYFDSIPVLFISGQVATSRLRPNDRLRQRGFQETDVVSIFRSITKYAVLIRKPEEVKRELEKAVYLARTGRPGPVLVDLPDDLQRVDLDPDTLPSFVAPPSEGVPDGARDDEQRNDVQKVLGEVARAHRPVLILGAGVRLARAAADAVAFAERMKLPVLLTWGGMDLLPRTHELNMGGLGVCGPRAGNFAVQNADLVMAMGTRLSTMITGGKQNLFAPRAKKIMVDLDVEELRKFGSDTFSLDAPIRCDLSRFFRLAETILGAGPREDVLVGWRSTISQWVQRYPACPASYRENTDRVNAYVFMQEFSLAAKEGDVVFTDAGGNLSWTMQGFAVKQGQRLLSAWNHSPMGFSLPAAIGAACGSGERVLCIIGDGGLMMCLQELATIRRHDLPVKVFVFNNRGHGIQKQTLDTWLSSRYVGVDARTGLWFPELRKVAEAFELPYVQIRNHAELKGGLERVLELGGPVLCDVEIVEEQRIVPMLKYGAGLEDLDPKLPAEELARIMDTAST
jgi:acetolactate synthase-1/2/3 large subunit